MFLSAIQTANLQYSYSYNELEAALVKNIKEPEKINLLARLIKGSQIKSKQLSTEIGNILTLVGNKKRAQLFTELAINIGFDLISNFLKENSLDIKNINNLVFTSCTIPAIPSIDVNILEKLGSNTDIKRIPIYQYGCLGGVSGLSLANQLSGNTLVLSVELCSLLYDPANQESETILGDVLFGDGAGVALLTNSESNFKILATDSYYIPNTSEYLGYNINDNGTSLVLKKQITTEIQNNFPRILEESLDKNNIKKDQIKHWLIHPGGVKILNSIENVIEVKSEFSWQVLNEFGNMSSAAIFYVIDKFLKSNSYKKDDLVGIVGLGPGMSIEIIYAKII